VVSSIFIEHFENLALGVAGHNHSLGLQHSEDTFLVWSDDLDSLQEFCNRINSLRPIISFTLEIETDSAIPFLDVLVIREDQH
jgi:hypothetical protein